MDVINERAIRNSGITLVFETTDTVPAKKHDKYWKKWREENKYNVSYFWPQEAGRRRMPTYCLVRRNIDLVVDGYNCLRQTRGARGVVKGGGGIFP